MLKQMKKRGIIEKNGKDTFIKKHKNTVYNNI